MTRYSLVPLAALAALAACSQDRTANADENGAPPASKAPAEESAGMPLPPSEDAAGTRPAGEAQMITVRGVVGEGTECPVLESDDGRRFALSMDKGDHAPGTRLEVTGEMADASFCMEGEGTLIPDRIVVLET